MTLKNNRAPPLCCLKLCAPFQSPRWIQTEVTVRKHSIRVKIGDLLSRVTLKFDRWLWKIIGHLFYVASSFVHHFKAIGYKICLGPKRLHCWKKACQSGKRIRPLIDICYRLWDEISGGCIWIKYKLTKDLDVTLYIKYINHQTKIRRWWRSLFRRSHEVCCSETEISHTRCYWYFGRLWPEWWLWRYWWPWWQPRPWWRHQMETFSS